MEALRKLRDGKAMDGIHERFGDMEGRGGGVKVSDLERRGVAR